MNLKREFRHTVVILDLDTTFLLHAPLAIAILSAETIIRYNISIVKLSTKVTIRESIPFLISCIK